MSFSLSLRTCLFCAVAAASFSGMETTAFAGHPAPETVSPEMAALVSAPAGALWTTAVNTESAMRAIAKDYAQKSGKSARELAQTLRVSVAASQMNGVPVFTLEPEDADKRKTDKVVLYLHGGGYVLGHGVAGIAEALPLTGWHGRKVISPDYRMAPEHPFPAAVDDAFSVYRELIRTVDPKNIVVYGTSTGGAMTLILGLQIAQAGLPMPAGLIAGTPWADMGKVGDSYVTHDGLDNVLGTYDALIASAVRFYAQGRDLKNPLISPVYAAEEDLRKFPPVLLISGTRDLFLSNTVRMQKRFLLLKKPVDLIVYEAMSHAQYYFNLRAPETVQHYRFLNDWLEKVW